MILAASEAGGESMSTSLPLPACAGATESVFEDWLAADAGPELIETLGSALQQRIRDAARQQHQLLELIEPARAHMRRSRPRALREVPNSHCAGRSARCARDVCPPRPGPDRRRPRWSRRQHRRRPRAHAQRHGPGSTGSSSPGWKQDDVARAHPAHARHAHAPSSARSQRWPGSRSPAGSGRSRQLSGTMRAGVYGTTPSSLRDRAAAGEQASGCSCRAEPAVRRRRRRALPRARGGAGLGAVSHSCAYVPRARARPRQRPRRAPPRRDTLISKLRLDDLAGLTATVARCRRLFDLDAEPGGDRRAPAPRAESSARSSASAAGVRITAP